MQLNFPHMKLDSLPYLDVPVKEITNLNLLIIS